MGSVRFPVDFATDLKDKKFDGIVLVTNCIEKLPAALQCLLAPLKEYKQVDAAVHSEVVLLKVPGVPGDRLVFAPTGPLDRDYDDVRRFTDAAVAGMKRALKAGMQSPLLVCPAHSTFKESTLVSVLGALHALYVPLEVREAYPEKPHKVDALGFWVPGEAEGRRIKHLACALESGRVVCRDIGGSDPERMAAPLVVKYVEELFNNTPIKVSVVSDVKQLEKEYPCLAAVNRCANAVPRHQARVIKLEYTGEGPIDQTLLLVGKGITYDTGGADIKAGGFMAGMHRDKCGSAAVAGFFQVLAELKPKNLKVLGAMAMVRNSVGADCYVADELITSRAQRRIRVGNTDAEGRMVMADLLSEMKERALLEVAPELFTIAIENEEETTEDSFSPDSKFHFKEALGPMPLAVMKARQLISWYTMAHNPNMPQSVNASSPAVVLPPVWVRCDSSDPEGTCWLGAETIRTDSKVTGINFHSVTCKGPVIGKASFINLDELKKAHKGRHHSSTVTTKGYAQYDLFGSTVVESSIIESQSSVVVDFTWNNVENILQTPPLTSAATLNIKVGSGDQRSPVYHLYKELEFLIVLAEGLKTGETDWPEPLETKTAVELVRALIEDLKNKFDVYQKQPAKESEKIKSDAASVEGSIQTAFVTDRGDLDFAEQLWSRMRRSVASYRDVVDSLTLVIQALKFGDIQPWIHRGSSSSLSKLIQQSYHGNMDNFSFTGLAPIRMLLEVGLDKMRKDYINYFIGQELTTLNYLDYFLSSSVDVQEQVQRLKKLHHMLEIVVNCNAFLNLAHEHLFPLTQSCLQFYKKHPYSEEHVFHLQIRPSVISSFYQNEHPQTWRVEVSSGHGQKEVKTTWQLSDKAPVEHVGFEIPDIPFETTINGESEEPAYFTIMISCSQVHFM